MEEKITLKVLSIRGTDSFMVRGGDLEPNHFKFKVDGVLLDSSMLRRDIVVHDKVEYNSCSKTIVEYRKDGKIMSVEEFRSKPTYYNDESTDEEILRRIANKKELEGFIPVYEESCFKEMELDVVGYVEDTGSGFIGCTITTRYGKHPVVYTVYGREVTLDEYDRLSKEYSEHAKFEKLDRHYLRFVKINNAYAFGNYAPFGDFEYQKSFSDLDKAKEYEAGIRKDVKDAVDKVVLKDKNGKISYFKAGQLLERLKLVRSLKTNASMKDSLGFIISDLEDYLDR